MAGGKGKKKKKNKKGKGEALMLAPLCERGHFADRAYLLENGEVRFSCADDDCPASNRFRIDPPWKLRWVEADGTVHEVKESHGFRLVKVEKFEVDDDDEEETA